MLLITGLVLSLGLTVIEMAGILFYTCIKDKLIAINC